MGPPRSAALFVAALRKAYNRAIDAGVLENNPCARIKTAKSGERERYLSKTELKRVLCGLGVLEEPYGDILRLILWTADEGLTHRSICFLQGEGFALVGS